MASTPLLSRSQIGLRPPRYVNSLPRPRGHTAHYWGDSPWGAVNRSSPARFRDSTNHNRCASLWRAAQSFHMSPGWGGTINGGADIAYSSGVCPHGVRFEGRGPGVRTGAQGTNKGNSESYATCYIAGGNDPLTDEAKLAFLDESMRLIGHNTPTWEHADWKNTACAGPNIRHWKSQGWSRPGTLLPPPIKPPIKPPTLGEITVSDVNKILKELQTIKSTMAQKSIAFRDPRDKKIWIVTPDGKRHHLPNPGHKAVNLLAFIGVLRPGGERWVHPISAENLDLIPKA